MKQRLDQKLVKKGFAPTRSQAQLLIREGKVKVNQRVIQKTGHEVTKTDQLEVENEVHYVSRGAYKLKAAIEAFQIIVNDKVIADCGASTGGFTDYLLQQGAQKSYCLDVGHDQLAPSLKKDSRVISLEGVNLRNPFDLPEKVDLVVADLSFISLRLVLNTLHSFLKKEGEMILLFKPQFEVGQAHIGKNGLVKNEKIRQKALQEFMAHCQAKGLQVKGVIECPLEGKQGNREYLLWLKIKSR